MKNNLINIIKMKSANFEIEKDCPVCGMDDWCGSDGCPLDPQ
jgi:hypothetical protein